MNQLDILVWDYILLALVLIALPIRGYLEKGKTRRLLAAGMRRAVYWDTIITLWITALAVLLVWAAVDRPFDALGFVMGADMPQVAGWGFVAIITIFLCWQVRTAQSDAPAAKAMMRQLDNDPTISHLMPVTIEERRLYNATSITAGITEEVIFRGYLIWLFSFWLPVSLAAAASVAVFVLAHLYQGTFGSLVRVAAIGTVLTLLYLWSGSLLPAIVLHSVVDIASGATVWHVRRLLLAHKTEAE